MLNKPLSQPEPKKSEASPHSPEVQRFIRANAAKRSIRSLSQSISILEGGIRALFQHGPKTIPEGLKITPFEPVGIHDSMLEARALILRFFETVGAQPLLDSPAPLQQTQSDRQKSAQEAFRQLMSGLTGCRNALKQLLDHADHFQKEKLGESLVGKRMLDRLATISTLLNENNPSVPVAAKPALEPLPKPSIPKIKKPKLTPIGAEKAKIVLELIEKNQHQFQTKAIFELAKEIAMIIEDEGTGPTFKELRELFECTDQELKKSLISLRSDLRHFNISILGAFKPHSSFPITFYA